MAKSFYEEDIVYIKGCIENNREECKGFLDAAKQIAGKTALRIRVNNSGSLPAPVRQKR